MAHHCWTTVLYKRTICLGKVREKYCQTE